MELNKSVLRVGGAKHMCSECEVGVSTSVLGVIGAKHMCSKCGVSGAKSGWDYVHLF